MYAYRCILHKKSKQLVGAAMRSRVFRSNPREVDAMDKLDRKLQLGRYDALLARHGDEELLNSFDALMREVAAKLQRRGAPKRNRLTRRARSRRA